MTGPFTPHVLFGLDPMWVSASVLALTYALIVSGRLNRAVVALIGASIVIVVGALDQNEAIAGINWNTIGLLTGMMILVSISRRSGVFQYLAIWSAQKAKASPAGILLMLQLTTALVSALLNNVSTVLLVAPVTLAITEELDLPPFPFLFAEIFASNIGGTATLIGDPPNILIGSSAGLDFNAFLVNLAPVIVLVLAAQLLMVHLIWGRRLNATPESRALVMGMNTPGMITDPVLLRQAVFVIGAVLAAFVFAGPLHLEPATIALAADPVEHEPRGFLSDTKRPRDFATTDAVLAIENHPSCGEPLLKADGGIFHDGSDLDGELPLRMAVAALPAQLIFQETDPITTASRTGYAVRPLRPTEHKIFQAVLRNREVQDCFLKGLWFVEGFHTSSLPQLRVLVKDIIARRRTE